MKVGDWMIRIMSDTSLNGRAAINPAIEWRAWIVVIMAGRLRVE